MFRLLLSDFRSILNVDFNFSIFMIYPRVSSVPRLPEKKRVLNYSNHSEKCPLSSNIITICNCDTATCIIKPTWLRVSAVEGRTGPEEPLRRGILAFQVSLKHWQSSSCPGFHATGQFFTRPFLLESSIIPAMTCIRMNKHSLHLACSLLPPNITRF